MAGGERLDDSNDGHETGQHADETIRKANAKGSDDQKGGVDTTTTVMTVPCCAAYLPWRPVITIAKLVGNVTRCY